MEILFKFIFAIHILLAIAICVFVLLQHGKGADLGAAFGGGASGSLFGAAGSANFLSRTTAVLVTLFFITSLALTYYGTKSARVGEPGDVMSGVGTSVPAQTAPAKVPAPAPVKPAPAPVNTPADVPTGK
jgi:preprotein translocase subunit SecG